MSIIFFTDPHLGLPRTANTTPASAAKLQDALYHQVLSIDSSLRRDLQSTDRYVCGGDMFDRFSNPEWAINQGMEVSSFCTMVLSGNHDVVNQADKMGSLHLVNTAIESLQGVPGPCVFAPFGQPWCQVTEFEDDGVVLFSVPHVANQELFEESLGLALDKVEKRSEKGDEEDRILLLHCNYNLSDDYATETSLNLKDEFVQELLGEFEYIILGHEHGPSEHFDNRLIILGNTHPTGFADISDKRIAIWKDGEMHFEEIWNKGQGYAEYNCADIPNSTIANFVRIVGESAPNGMLEITKQVKRMWEQSENLYAVKMDVTLPSLADLDSGKITKSLSQLPEIIKGELKSQPDLLELWEKLVEEESE